MTRSLRAFFEPGRPNSAIRLGKGALLLAPMFDFIEIWYNRKRSHSILGSGSQAQ
jgi:hypothetical protein